ncbi:carbohydrate binding domain-containing protein [Kitasatospora sp. NPDC017646]|uniref:carbohydrate binding domain-containing protein n=1 Tax=Kitasatospora sp. NPDC017646 TaxID=3364024 RepID=UPI0037B8F3C3
MPSALQHAPTHRRPAGRTELLSLAAATVLAAGGLAALAGNAGAADADLLANGGLESGLLDPWSCSAGTGTVVNSGAHGGTYALKGAASASDTAQCGQTVSVQPNTTYSLSAWVQGRYVYLGATGSGVTDPAVWTPAAPTGSSCPRVSPPARAPPASPSTCTAGTGRAPTSPTTWRSPAPAAAARRERPPAPRPARPPADRPPRRRTSRSRSPPTSTWAPGPPRPCPTWPRRAASRATAWASSPASAARASWFNAYDPRTGWAKDQVDALRAAGGDVKLSFGADGPRRAAGTSSRSGPTVRKPRATPSVRPEIN